MHRVSRVRRALRWCVAALLFALSSVLLLALYLRRDQRHVFAEVHASIVRTEVVDSWSTETVRVEKLQFLDADGWVVVRAYVRRPLGPTQTSAQAMVVYAGKDTGAQILDLVPERPDLTVVAPLYPDLEPKTWWQKLGWLGAVRHAVFRTVAGGMAGLDHLRRDGTETGRTVALAASLGTSFGTIHAALDPRVDELVIVHGGGDFPVILRHIYTRREKPLMAAVLPWVAEGALDTFDPVHWIGDVAPRPVLLIAARRDHHFPAASIEALHQAAGAPKELRWTDTEHVGAAKAEIVAQVMAEVEAYLDRPRPAVSQRPAPSVVSSGG